MYIQVLRLSKSNSFYSIKDIFKKKNSEVCSSEEYMTTNTVFMSTVLIYAMAPAFYTLVQMPTK